MKYISLIMGVMMSVGLFAPGYQKIKLDDKYNNIRKAGSPDPLHYTINAGSGFILDCSNYDFSAIKKMNDNKLPDAIHVVCKSGTFDVALNRAGETTIDGKTLKTLGVNEVFKGFVKGDHVILGIGTTHMVEGKADMKTYWMTLMEVK